MKYDFTHKVTLVTGASSGIGRACAQYFAECGAIVYLLDNRKPTFNLLENMHYMSVDVTDKLTLAQTVNHIAQQHARLDYCIANAGVHFSANIVETNEENLNALIDTNIKGSIYTLQTVLPVMQQQATGSIVLMASDQAHIAKQACSIYGASKAAIAHLAKSCAIDFAQDNIRINALCPGSVHTPLYDTVVKEYSEKLNLTLEQVHEKFVADIPQQRAAKPIEIARVAAFLCSDDASFITGANINADGGYTAQ